MELLPITVQRTEIRFAGSGGQGLIKLGIILAEAAMLDGKNVVQTQSYGAEARGGASRSDVILSDDQIDFPSVTSLDVLLAMNQESYDKYIGLLKPHGIVIFDSSNVKPALIGGIYQYGAPFTKIALELGGKIYANIVALGYFVALTKLVSRENVLKVLRKRLPKDSISKNLEAFERGYRLGCTR
mgnify:CR=1 FL=1